MNKTSVDIEKTKYVFSLQIGNQRKSDFKDSKKNIKFHPLSVIFTNVNIVEIANCFDHATLSLESSGITSKCLNVIWWRKTNRKSKALVESQYNQIHSS